MGLVRWDRNYSLLNALAWFPSATFKFRPRYFELGEERGLNTKTLVLVCARVPRSSGLAMLEPGVTTVPRGVEPTGGDGVTGVSSAAAVPTEPAAIAASSAPNRTDFVIRPTKFGCKLGSFVVLNRRQHLMPVGGFFWHAVCVQIRAKNAVKEQIGLSNPGQPLEGLAFGNPGALCYAAPHH